MKSFLLYSVTQLLTRVSFSSDPALDVCALRQNVNCANNPNCLHCDAPTQTCSQCKDGYFRAAGDFDLCLPCSNDLMPGCDFCDDLIGCQQCLDPAVPTTPANSCEIRVCNDDSQVPQSTMAGEALSYEETLNQLYGDWFDGTLDYSDFWMGNARVVIDGIVGGGELVEKIGNLCDVASLTTTKNFRSSSDERLQSIEFYTACTSSENGQYWINGLNMWEWEVAVDLDGTDESTFVLNDFIIFFPETDIDFVRSKLLA